MNFLFFIFWVTASSADPIVKTALARPFQFQFQEGFSHDHFEFNSLIGPIYFLVGNMS